MHIFRSARLKLTAWYLLIISFISLFFSASIYNFLITEVQRFEQAQRFRIERRFEGNECAFINGQTVCRTFTLPLPDSELVDETRQRILLSLGVVNGIIIFSSAVLGYFLAGRTLRPIQEMLHEQHRFISDASHELRTPLTSLKSAFEVYLRNRKRTKAEADQLVTESIGEVDKLKMLSDSLLSLAHYELPERPLFTTISSKDIVEFAYKRIKNMAEQQHIRFEFPDTAISFQGNFDSVTDLFVILFDNAIKYSPEGSTVSISQEIKDGSVLFSVTDRGIGIAKSDLPHIFDRFYRADAARSRSNMGGYGLGLSIAKKIADMHNGSLRVESIIGKGTTFFVRFPKKHR